MNESPQYTSARLTVTSSSSLELAFVSILPTPSQRFHQGFGFGTSYDTAETAQDRGIRQVFGNDPQHDYFPLSPAPTSKYAGADGTVH